MDNKKEFWKYDTKPFHYISILIASYNTDPKFVKECLLSIQKQVGNFGVELVWIDDGSFELNSKTLITYLSTFKNGKKNFKIKYYKFDQNKGLSHSLNYGVKLCSSELIFRMDSDDVMKPPRLYKQLVFMLENKECVLCGTGIIPFVDKNDVRHYYRAEREHPEILTWEEYKQTKHTWLLNHPTLCFKKSAVLTVGNYDANLKLPFEDLDLELRILKKYGFICNLKEKLLFYRVHTGQITYKCLENNEENNILKAQLIENLINT
jgi:glycosyltransferase involved in cell wall biosynthesis